MLQRRYGKNYDTKLIFLNKTHGFAVIRAKPCLFASCLLVCCVHKLVRYSVVMR